MQCNAMQINIIIAKSLRLSPTHCTMQLSIEIEDFQVFKSKGLDFAQFWSKIDNSSSDWWTTVRILEEKYLHHIFAKNVVSIGKKLVPGVSET